MAKFSLISGVLLCLSGVSIGAFGAHAFADLLQLNGRIDTFELANRYHFYHGLALLIVGALSPQIGLKSRVMPSVMILGVCVFCGSLYALALLNVTWLGAITPIGGVLLLAAWVLLLRAVWRDKY